MRESRGLLAITALVMIIAFAPASAAAGPSGWGSPTVLDSGAAGSAELPQVAHDGLGNAFVVWHESDGVRNNIWAARYTPAGGWSAAELLETNDTGDAVLPQVAANAAGNALAAWRQFDGTRTNVWAAHYADGSGWGPAVLLEADDRGWAQHPQLAMDASGNGFAVWAQDDGNYTNIYAARYLAGAGWTVPSWVLGAAAVGGALAVVAAAALRKRRGEEK